MQWIHRLAPDFKRIHEVSALTPGVWPSPACFRSRSSPLPSGSRRTRPGSTTPTSDRRITSIAASCSICNGTVRGRSGCSSRLAHLSGLEALLETYPDAGIIQTHRDPLAAIPSLASLRTVLQARSAIMYPLHIGLETTRYCAQVPTHRAIPPPASCGAQSLLRCTIRRSPATP